MGGMTLLKRPPSCFWRRKHLALAFSGPDEMGKILVSLGEIEQPLIKTQFLLENCNWMPCIEATSEALLLEILSNQLKVNTWKWSGDDWEDHFSTQYLDTTPSDLARQFRDTLHFVLGGTLKQVEDIPCRLAVLSHVAILVTIQGLGRYPPSDEAIKWQSKTSDLSMKQPAFVYTTASIQIRKMIVMLVDCGAYWDTCLSQLHLWRNWPMNCSQRRRSYYLYGLSPGLTSSDHHEQIMNRSISLSVDISVMRQNRHAFKILLLTSRNNESGGTLTWILALKSLGRLFFYPAVKIFLEHRIKKITSGRVDFVSSYHVYFLCTT